MKFNEINAKFTNEELRQIPGNGELRFNILFPILTNLYQNKLIYRERFTCIVSLKDIELSAKGFGATCTPILSLEMASQGGSRGRTPPDEWRFRGNWDFIGIRQNCIGSTWGGWTIWPESDLVEEVILLATRGDIKNALALLDK